MRSLVALVVKDPPEFWAYFHMIFLSVWSAGSTEELQDGERSAAVGPVGEPGRGEAERRARPPEPAHGHHQLPLLHQVSGFNLA